MRSETAPGSDTPATIGIPLDSLTRTRWTRRAAIGAGTAALLGLVLAGMLRPEPEPSPEDAFVQGLLQQPFAQSDAATREEMRRQWEEFPPEVRSRIFTNVARARLDTLRQELDGLGADERSERVRQALVEMRLRRQQLGPEDQRRIQERLATPEARQMVTAILGFYRDELTARERAELDPLLQEWLWQIEQLGRRQR